MAETFPVTMATVTLLKSSHHTLSRQSRMMGTVVTVLVTNCLVTKAGNLITPELHSPVSSRIRLKPWIPEWIPVLGNHNI